jgi:predicted Zn finger-like uncharacterized protein
MKIACESCGAKYSIADEKVQGKVFKIRCKRCSEVIVVRGDGQGGAASPAAAASTPAGEAIWHVVINGDQAGPYSPEQLADMLAGGTVDWDAYVWAEGFDNWVPMRDVEALVSQISGGGSAASAQADARMSFAETPDAFASAQPAFGGQPSMGADPFADEPPTTAFGGNISAEPDLFGGGGRAQATPFDSGGHVHASAPMPRTAAAAPAASAAADAMTGARNENSVLFSLKNLQALATGSGPSMPASATAAASSAGYAGGEGSGLIDIRALASATGMNDGEPKDAKDELLSIGNQGAFGALGSPMLAPAHDDDGGSKKMMIWAGVVGFGMLLAAGVAAMFIMTRQQTPAPGVGVSAAPVAVAPVPAAAATADGDDKPTEGELAARAAAAKDEGDTQPERTGSSTGGTRRPKPATDGTPAAETKPEPAAEKAPAKPSGPRTIDDLLDGALSPGSPKPKPKVEAPAANLPDLPSRDDVVSAMSGVKNAVSACAQGQTGVAFVNVSVAGATGRVTSAEVSGITGPAGSCIAKAVRAADFPKFAQKVFKVKYPFKL